MSTPGTEFRGRATAVPVSARPARPTLLVVDDEPEVLHSVHDLLRLEYRVLTCEKGAQAVEILRSDEPIHVVMSDQRMPGMTGVEVLKHARRLRPEATRLLFTAYADVKAVVDAINQGHVFRYITKPWDPDELQTVIRQAVDQYELVAERDRLLSELTETNQRLIEANRLKSAFIEVASHELNTPVAVVLGLAQLWKLTQDDAATPAQRHWVERMQHAGKRLAATVERMLKLIKADEFAQPIETRPTELEPLIHEAIEEVSPFLSARRQSVELKIDPALGTAEVDPDKISDTLMNLLINAIKFTPDDGVVRVEAGPAPDLADHIRIAVSDRGIGISPEMRPYVFEPFFTGFDTMHHSSGEFGFCKRGIGLGLCLVKRFVEMHRGRVDFASEPGSGSTFSFTLPRRRPGLRLVNPNEPPSSQGASS
ncbi:MAG: hybrid sensor histidine kinase/response regulator [Isosphaeraceae bacterium]